MTKEGTAKGPFLEHFIWLLLCLLSATRGWGERRWGSQDPPKGDAQQGAKEQDGWAPGRKPGLRHSIRGQEERVKHGGLRDPKGGLHSPEHSATKEAPPPAPPETTICQTHSRSRSLPLLPNSREGQHRKKEASYRGQG